MSDLIDRQALLKQIDIDSDGEPGYYGDTWKFIDTIKNMPIVHDLPKDTDTISRQAAIDLLKQMRKDGNMVPWEGKDVFARIRKLPPAQPEIIRCRECKFASGDSRICMKFDHSPIGELDFCAWAERRTDE